MTDSYDIQARFYEVLGRITATMSKIEQTLRMYLCKISFIDRDLGLKLTHDMYFKKLVELLKRSMKHHVNEKTYKEFQEIISKLKNYDEERNNLVHSAWSFEPEINIMVGTKLAGDGSGSIKLEHIEADIEKMWNTSIKMSKGFIDLFNFFEKILRKNGQDKNDKNRNNKKNKKKKI